MAFWRKYIVLRDKRAAARGYVRLSMSGGSMEVFASAPLKKDKYELLLFGQGFTQRMDVHMRDKTAVSEGRVFMPKSERILAAILCAGRMVLLGESDGALSDWRDMEDEALRRGGQAASQGKKRKATPENRWQSQSWQEHLQVKQAQQNRPNAERKRSEPPVASPQPLVQSEDGLESSDYAHPPFPPRKARTKETIQAGAKEISIDVAEPAVITIEAEPAFPDELADAPTVQPEPILLEDTEAQEPSVQSEPEAPAAEVLRDKKTTPAPLEFPGSKGGMQAGLPLGLLGEPPVLRGKYSDKWEWDSVSVPGSGYTYLIGRVESGGEIVAVAVAVAGEYAPAPPPNLNGFSGYTGGYWVLAQDAQTGERLSI